MFKPMKKSFFALAILASLFAACDPEPEPKPSFPTVKLLATDVTGKDSSALSYDAKGRLVLYEQHDPAFDFSAFLKPAFENDRLTSVLVGLAKADITHKFKTYDYNSAGKVAKIYSYEYGFDKYAGYDSLLYDASGLVQTIYVAAITEVGGKVAIFQKNVFERDTKGNIAKSYSIPVEDGKESKDTTTTVYTYDDKINYVAKQPELVLMQTDLSADAFSPNNVLTAVSTSANGGREITNVYAYDSDNYPVTITTTEKELQGGVVVDTRSSSHVLTYIKM
jgi:hypothetical protein